jgi:hypothetical protein
VAFKLDIDNSEVEAPILKALTEDPEALALVDEFFFEHRGFRVLRLSLCFLARIAFAGVWGRPHRTEQTE